MFYTMDHSSQLFLFNCKKLISALSNFAFNFFFYIFSRAPEQSTNILNQRMDRIVRSTRNIFPSIGSQQHKVRTDAPTPFICTHDVQNSIAFYITRNGIKEILNYIKSGTIVANYDSFWLLPNENP